MENTTTSNDTTTATKPNQNDRSRGRIVYEQNQLAQLDARIPTLKEGSPALAKALNRRAKTVELIASIQEKLEAREAKQAARLAAAAAKVVSNDATAEAPAADVAV